MLDSPETVVANSFPCSHFGCSSIVPYIRVYIYIYIYKLFSLNGILWSSPTMLYRSCRVLKNLPQTAMTSIHNVFLRDFFVNFAPCICGGLEHVQLPNGLQSLVFGEEFEPWTFVVWQVVLVRSGSRKISLGSSCRENLVLLD